MQVKIDFFIYKYLFRTSVKLFYIKKSAFTALLYIYFSLSYSFQRKI